MASTFRKNISRLESADRGLGLEGSLISIVADDEELCAAVIRMLSPEGSPIDKVGNAMSTVLTGSGRSIHIVGCSRYGLATSCLSRANEGLDLFPCIPLATQYAACAASQPGVLLVALRSGAELSSNEDGSASASSSLLSTTPHLLLEELSAITSVANYCCPSLAAKASIEGLIPHEGGAIPPSGPSQLPSHLLIVNVVSSPTLSSGQLDSITGCLSDTLLKVEPTYDPVTAARLEQASARNDCRMAIHSRSGGFASISIVTMKDLSCESEGQCAVDITSSPSAWAEGRSRLNVLWQLVAATHPNEATSSSIGRIATLGPTEVARRIEALSAIASVPMPPHMASRPSEQESSGPAHEARRLWVDLYIRTAVHDRFYTYCHARQARLTIAMVKEAYETVTDDCLKVSSAVLDMQQSETGDHPYASIIKDKLQEGHSRFMGIAESRAAHHNAGGGSNSYMSKGTIVSSDGSVLSRFRNDHRTQTVARHATTGARVVLAHTSELARWFKEQVNQRVPHQYRFWLTGHGALIILGIALFLILSVMARKAEG